MKKMNNKGFALVETLIVSAFVMGIFSLMFTNFYPMIGEYEKRENYDDIDSVYKTYYLKNKIEQCFCHTPNNVINNVFPQSYITSLVKNKDDCHDSLNAMANKFKVNKIILTNYNISDIKNSISISDSYFKDYVSSLPDFTSNPKGLKYRIIVEYQVDVNLESGNGKKTIYRFSTIGVNG